MKKDLLFLVSLLFVVAACTPDDPPVTDNRLVIYPNPAVNDATIVVRNQSLPFTVTAFDANGKSILNETSTGQQTQFSLTLTESGTYHVVVKIKNDEVRQTVIRL